MKMALIDATEPAFAVGDRVRALVDHMAGMTGMVGRVDDAHAGDPPYYAVEFDEPDGMENPHKWLTEDEIEAEGEDDGAMPMPSDADSQGPKDRRHVHGEGGGMNPRQWYKVEAKADEAVADLYIFDDIGKSYWNDDAVSAKQFVKDLNGLPESVTGVRVHVNSLGGDMFDGIAIANALRAFRLKGRSVETISEGVAASAASIVMMAGAPITMSDNATMMVHDPWGFVLGNARDMRKAADIFDGFKSSIVSTYQWNTNLSAEEVSALMSDETWLDADEAIEKGFATNKVSGLKAAACLNRGTYAKLTVPKKFKAQVEALLTPAPPDPAPPAPAPAFDALPIITACTTAGLSELAGELVAAKASADQVTARLAEETRTRAAARQRETDIRAACAMAKAPELADGYIAGAMAVTAVKAHLTVITAKLDKVEIDTGLVPDRTGKVPSATADLADSYRKLNAPAKTKE